MTAKTFTLLAPPNTLDDDDFPIRYCEISSCQGERNESRIRVVSNNPKPSSWNPTWSPESPETIVERKIKLGYKLI